MATLKDRCTNCGKPLQWEFGSVGYIVVKTVHCRPCERCYHETHEKKVYRFCCRRCLDEWVKGGGEE